MKKAILKVRPYHHSKTHKFLLDLRGFGKGKGRLFFKTRAEADSELARQRSLLERHSREAIGLSPREMSDFIHARDTLANYRETINALVALLESQGKMAEAQKTAMDMMALLGIKQQ